MHLDLTLKSIDTLQREQARHDRDRHRESAVIPLPQRLTQTALQFAKFYYDLDVEAEKPAENRPRVNRLLTDFFILTLAGANARNLSLAAALADRPPVAFAGGADAAGVKNALRPPLRLFTLAMAGHDHPESRDCGTELAVALAAVAQVCRGTAAARSFNLMSGTRRAWAQAGARPKSATPGRLEAL